MVIAVQAALSEDGLPPHEVPLALLMFNVGAKIGQRLIISMVAALFVILHKVRRQWTVWLCQLPACGIGSIAAFWLIERLSAF